MKKESKKLQVFHFPPDIDGGLGLKIADHDTIFDDKEGISLSNRPHRHTFFEILYYTAGKGTHFIDFKPYPLKPPVFFFITPGQVHFWKVEEPLKGKLILFTEDFLVLNPPLVQTTLEDLHFFYNAMQQPELQLTDQQQLFDAKIEEMEHEFSSGYYGRTNMLRASLHILLIHLLRMYTPENQNGGHTSYNLSMVLKFKRKIAEKPVINLSLEYYANTLGISLVHLSEIVKRTTGFSPGKLIRHEIALEAKRLLAHSDMSAAQIGYELQFDDPSYFGRFFKRETGLSPRQFRKRTREKYQLFLE